MTCKPGTLAYVKHHKEVAPSLRGRFVICDRLAKNGDMLNGAVVAGIGPTERVWWIRSAVAGDMLPLVRAVMIMGTVVKQQVIPYPECLVLEPHLRPIDGEPTQDETDEVIEKPKVEEHETQ